MEVDQHQIASDRAMDNDTVLARDKTISNNQNRAFYYLYKQKEKRNSLHKYLVVDLNTVSAENVIFLLLCFCSLGYVEYVFIYCNPFTKQ